MLGCFVDFAASCELKRVNRIKFKQKKLIFQTRRIIIISSMLILLFSSCLSYAVDQPHQFNLEDTHSAYHAKNPAEKPSAPKIDYNKIYQFINDHEYLFTPLSGTLAGGIRCGILCAFGGGILGAIDESLVYFGYSDKHYLTWGVFGATIGHTINSSALSDFIGIAVGVLLPTGILNDHIELVAPIIVATVNPMIGLSYIADDLAIHSGITDKHYMTFLVVGNKIATKLSDNINPIYSFLIVAFLSPIATNYEEEIYTNFLTPAMLPIKTTENMYVTYSKFIPKEQLDSNLEKLALAMISNQFLVRFISLKTDIHKQSIVKHFHDLDTQPFGRFTPKLIDFTIFIFPHISGQVVVARITSYFNKKTKYFLEDTVRSELLSDKTALCLSDNPDVKVLTDNLKGDISTITKSGSKLLAGAISSSINGMYGIGVIMLDSSDILTYSCTYGLMQSFVSTYIAKQQRFYEEKITVLNSNIRNVLQHDADNIRTIVENDGIDVTKTRLQQLYDEARVLEADKEVWSSTNSFWEQTTKNANYIIAYYLVGNEINQNNLPFDNRVAALSANQGVSNWLSWSGLNARELSQLEQALTRITTLEEKIREQSSNKDQINRITHEGNQLLLQNFEMKTEEETLVLIEDLKLEMGKTYAITGKPGCGKTNLLFKIKGVKSHGISGKGHIYYPLIDGKEPKIVMVSQQNYFPVNFSLQQIISYPNKIPDDPILYREQQNEIRALLEEIGFRETNGKEKNGVLNLDSIKNWSNVLSGGEKGKIMIVSSIMKKPDILILDETFDSLGTAVVTAQQMLKKYLPNTLILVVDHYARANNYNNFYYKELHFIDKSIVVQEESFPMQDEPES